MDHVVDLSPCISFGIEQNGLRGGREAARNVLPIEPVVPVIQFLFGDGEVGCPQKMATMFLFELAEHLWLYSGDHVRSSGTREGKKQKLRKLLVQPGQCNHQHFLATLAWNVFGFGLWGISH